MGILKRRAKSGMRYRSRVQHQGHITYGTWRDAKWKAQEDEAAMRRAIASDTFSDYYGPNRVPTVSDIARDYLIECSRLVDVGTMAPRTLNAHRRNLRKRILPAFGDWRIDRVKFLDVQRFKREVFRETSGPTSNRQLATFSGLFRHARGHIEANPCAGVARYPENTDAWYAVNQEEAETLIEHGEADKNPNMGPFLLLLWEAMLRSKSEARTIRREHIDWNWKDGEGVRRGLIYLPTTKGGDDQVVPASLQLRKRLREHLESHDSEWLFPNHTGEQPMHESTMYAAWKRIKDDAGVSAKLRLHDFRHGGATDLIGRGAPRALVQALLRHKTRVMTDRYTHLTEKHAAMALAVREKVAAFDPNRAKNRAKASSDGTKG